MHLLKFYLNNKPVTVDFSLPQSPSPLCSVLHYLRNWQKLTGTKEVCGKGDCGACTVIIVSPATGLKPVTYQAVDSCLLRLPDLHGKHLLTIEAPAAVLDTEPIRNAFLKERGSQCGFCSPGMVLSTYAHVKNKLPFTRESIQRSLSGNLCRCTGYIAIYNAAASLENITLTDRTPAFPSVEKGLLIFEKDNVTYCVPHTADELSQAWTKYPQARLAGGFTGSAMSFEPSDIPVQIIDVSQISDWRDCTAAEDGLHLGASCNLETLRTFIRPYYPSVASYLDDFAGAQIRNKATLGGSLADGSPVGDSMPFCMALKGTVVLWGLNGTREVDMNHFMLGYRKVDIAPHEAIAQIRLPLPQDHTHYFVYKQTRRKNMDISAVSFACAIQIKDRKCADVQLVFGGVAATTVHAKQTEKYLKGKVFSLANCKKAGNVLERDFSPLSDIRGSKDYRMNTAKNLLILQFEQYKEDHNG